MKQSLLLFAAMLLLLIQGHAQTGVAINTTGIGPDSSAMLDVSSTEKGILVPRMTEAQRMAIADPATGLLVYQNDGIEGFYYYDGTVWTRLANGIYIETDPIFTGSQAANITATDITNLGNLSGTNTGDQDISGIAANAQAIIDTAGQIRADIPDISGFITTEIDPVFDASAASSINAADIDSWNNKISSQWTTNASNIYYNAGKVGIGSSSPRALLDLSNSVSNRKIILYSSADNDHEFTGLGINYDAFRFQVANTAGSFKFFGATSSASSTELFRIQGNGQIVIPALTSAGILLNDASGVISSSIGASGQVLTATGSGGIGWSTPATGTVTSVTGTAPIDVATGTTSPVISISPATTSASGSMSASDKTKLDGIAENANNYIHPSGDGNMHVPATGTANNGKVLTAGATAGSLSWETPSSGLNNFTESNYLYGGKAGVRLLATIDSAKADFVISPKGEGGILAQQPDGTYINGNVRGKHAIDFQQHRVQPYQVASGGFSVIAGGDANTASGWASFAMGSLSVAQGDYSVAMGHVSKALGDYSTALGVGALASGIASTAIGVSTSAIGASSVAIGNRITAPSFQETAFGYYNTEYTPINDTNWNENDRLFVIGNGTSSITKSNALTILKNANMTIGGSLTINGNGTSSSITLPAGRGTSGQVLTTDGSGGTSWTATSSGTVTGVSGTAPIVSTGGTAPVISINPANPSAAGSMSAADKLKLDAITGTNTGDQTITLTGDVTGTGTGAFAATIASAAVSNAKLANMDANTIKVNNTSASTSPSDLSIAVNTFPARSSTGNIAAKTISDFALSILDDADAAAVRATIGAGTGSGVIEVADQFSANGSQTSFTLSQTPSSNSKVKLFINGVRITNAAYTVSGSTLTYIPENNFNYPLTAGDRIQMDYFYE